ncbi:MAG: (2Fe-2S)-binding protein [Cypionkella sp.]
MAETDKGRFPLVLVATEPGVRAYENACQYSRQDYLGGQTLSGDGAPLMCTAHAAQFDELNGTGVACMGLGCNMDAVRLIEVNGALLLAERSKRRPRFLEPLVGPG